MRREAMKIRTALLAATVLSLPVAVTAQPINGPYVSAGAGINIMQDMTANKLTVGGATLSGNQSVGTNLGFAGVAALGYGLGNGFRMEVEGDYRNNALANDSNHAFKVHGQEEKYGVMVNGLYDFAVNFPVTPYIGAGVGYSWNQINSGNFYINGQPGNIRTSGSNPGSFAYQGIIGASYPLKAIPGLALTAEGRFFGLAGDRNFTGTAYNGKGGSTNGAVQFTDDYNWSVLIGLRYAFNTVKAAPAPMAPAPAAMSKNYLVFFDWDRADLTARAKEIIAEAAANTKKVAVTKIAVNGYTDLSGTAAYNQGLSVRRAKAVAAELVKDGVPAKEIGIQGFGESNPLVPTAQGVREPQNRRVEIIFQ
jgi:outer membrane protein OmpA-like peptidoglycan-associated protein